MVKRKGEGDSSDIPTNISYSVYMKADEKFMPQPSEATSTNRVNCMPFYQSLRDIQYGVQMSAAFVFSILFAFSSSYGKTLQSQWLISVLATLVSLR